MATLSITIEEALKELRELFPGQHVHIRPNGMMRTEEWMPVISYEGRYEVSSFGRGAVRLPAKEKE